MLITTFIAVPIGIVALIYFATRIDSVTGHFRRH